jgi:uridine nucleosidase
MRLLSGILFKKIDPKMQTEEKISIWLDCDPGLDDTFAIIYAGHAKEFDLFGVSTSPGNTSLANTTQNALDVLYNIGRRDVPVFAGSNSLIKG